MIDLQRVRADTPACAKVIHFNNAGASLMPDPVFHAMSAHLQLEREMGGYEAARLAASQIDGFYTEFAALLGCEPREVAFVENATRAWDMAFYGLPLEKGDRILAHESEYSSNYLALLQRSRQRGLEIDLVPSAESGQIDVAAMEAMIGSRTRLILLTHVPTQGGLVNPAEAVGRIASKHNILYMLDACQSAGQIDIDVKKIGCHVLSGTGRKFLRGPRGTGFLYVAADVMERIEPAFVDMRAANWTAADQYELAPGAQRYETWESFVAGRIGLAHAVQYARGIGIAEIEERVTQLSSSLRNALANTPGLSVHDQGARQCGIVTFAKEDEPAHLVAARLFERGINVSVIDALSARIDFAARDLDQLVRASVHYYNTEDEIDRVVAAIAG
jgi:selenocysteine lyase/cysteine desulfurase